MPPLRSLVPAAMAITAACGTQPGEPASGRWRPVSAALDSLIRRDMEMHAVPSLAIALVAGNEIIWERGYGDSTGATTIQRVGSVSKMFTDMAVLRLAGEGRISIDSPVGRYLAEWRPRDPRARDVTLRQLMSHRAGLVREPGVGNYFDPEPASLSATVASLNAAELIYAPGQRFKYSNAGIAVVGRVVETITGIPFADYMRDSIIRPIGMATAGFTRPSGSVARGFMWAYDRSRFDAPVFELGMAPAGSLYASVRDLAAFLTAVFDPRAGMPFDAALLESMWDPSGGFGFFVSEVNGERKVSHDGAMYGFATELAALPDRELGVIVVAGLDFANAITGRIADHALRLMLATAEGVPLPALALSDALAPDRARQLAGTWAGRTRRLEFVESRQGLRLRDPTAGGVRALIRARGDTLTADGPLQAGGMLIQRGDTIFTPADTLLRQRRAVPVEVPVSLAGYVGEYGWDHDILYVFEDQGRLWILIEWFAEYPLTAVASDTFRLPDHGLYAGERVVFDRDDGGVITGASVGIVRFQRRRVGPGDGDVFRIDPLEPVAALRQRALAATPPVQGGTREPDLVDLRTEAPGLRLDVRYASTDNFMGAPFYDAELAFAQRPVAAALGRALASLATEGFGLVVHDGYRPWHVTRMFWDATPDSLRIFVADPATGSRHNRGAAIDLSLTDRTGRILAATSGYDEFTDRAFPYYPGGTARQRYFRDRLRHAMEEQGFTVYDAEWWHFDHSSWRDYPVMNVTFDEISR